MSYITRSFDIALCTDKDWRVENRHQIDITGFDGGGEMMVQVPLTEDDLDELIIRCYGENPAKLVVVDAFEAKNASSLPWEEVAPDARQDTRARSTLEVVMNPGSHWDRCEDQIYYL